MRKSILFFALTALLVAGLCYTSGSGAEATGLLMALTIPPTFPARNTGEQQVHFFRKRVQFADIAALTAGLKIGRLPAKAFITGVEFFTTATPFNSATTDTISVGTTAATGTEICAATTVHTASTYARVASPAGAGLAVTNAGEVDVFLKYAQSGAVATAGDATVVVSFIPDIDQ